MGDEVYFVADDGVHGFELWKSDGTEAGTGMVADLHDGESRSYPHILTAVGDSLAFWANPSEEDYQVYRLTSGSRVPVKVTSFQEDYPASLFAGPDDSLFIFTRENSETSNIWCLPADGVSADLAETLSAGVGAYSYSSPLLNFDGEMFFTFMEGRENPVSSEFELTAELRALGTDGVPSRLVKTFSQSEPISDGDSFALLDGAAYFSVDDFETDRVSLWKTDGTESGTQALTDTEEGVSVEELHTFGNALFMGVGDPHHGAELWTSDGTAEGTVLHADINLSTADNLQVWDEKLYFGAWDDSGPALWQSDGTARGTGAVAATPPASGYSPHLFSDGGERLFFFSGGNDEGFRLWASEGTEEGTVELADVGPQVTALRELNGEQYFIRQEDSDSETGYSPQLWKTDGTTEGTALVVDLAEDFPGMTYSLVRAGDRLIFDVANLDTRELQLWTSDGTADGTAALDASLPAGFIREIAVTVSGDVLFPIYGGEGDMMLWKSDGTAEGTAQVILLGTDGAVVAADLVPVGNRVFFRVYRRETLDAELWVTGGTEETTQKVADLNLDGHDDVGGLTAFDDGVAFAANDGSHGRELWSSDGTDEGTHMVCNAYRGDSNPQNPFLLGGRLYFTAVDGEGNINLMEAVAGSSGCSALSFPALGMMLLPLLVLLKK